MLSGECAVWFTLNKTFFFEDQLRIGETVIHNDINKRPHRRFVVPSVGEWFCPTLTPIWFFGPTRASHQTLSRSVQPFLRTLQQRLPMLFNRADNPQNNCTFSWAIWTPSNIQFLGPTWVSPQMACRSVQPFLQGLRTWPMDTDRQTDRHIDWPCYKVPSNSPHLMQSCDAA